MQKPVIKMPYHVTRGSELLESTTIEFAGQRFMNTDMPGDGVLDTTGGPPSMRYMRYSGWVILKHLVDTILYFRPYSVVEIGCGESSYILGEATEKHGVKFYSCDIKQEKAQVFHRKHYHTLGTSEEFRERFDDTPAIVLIDANHSYENAKEEFDFFFDILVPGGVIFLHDTMSPNERMLSQHACGDVYKLRQELEHRTDEMDCFTWPYTAKWCGLTQVIKKDPDRPYWEK